jgi:hypothetical protein
LRYRNVLLIGVRDGRTLSSSIVVVIVAAAPDVALRLVASDLLKQLLQARFLFGGRAVGGGSVSSGSGTP